MSKLEVFEGKQTTWGGLWYHPETASFSSASIDLSVLKKFKGTVRLYVRKNKFYNKGENGRPNYCFCLKDSASPSFSVIEVEEDKACEKNACYYNEDDDCCYDNDGNRLYTYSEVEKAIFEANDDGYNHITDIIVEDYIY